MNEKLIETIERHEIIEVPDFTGYHHQHLFYFNSTFISRLCKDKTLKIIDYSVDRDTALFVIVHKNNENFEPVKIKSDINAEIKRAEGIHDEMGKRTNLVESVLRDFTGEKLYWWGAGSSSVILLNQIDRDLIMAVDLVIVDGDPSKAGNFIPGVDVPVNSFEIIENKTIDCMIIASSFYDEIQSTMKNHHISAKEVLIVNA